MKRRDFLGLMAATPFALQMKPALSAAANHDYQLKAQKTLWEIIEGEAKTKIWSFGKEQFAMPIMATQGDILRVGVENQLAEGLGVHWHGIRLPNAMDGVPHLTQKSIASRKGQFEYAFAPPDAGTFWYHSHSNSSEQIERGLLGPLIVREHKAYPVDVDQVLLLKDWRLGKDLQISQPFRNRHEMAHDGRLGNVPTVNGIYQPIFEFPGNARVRLRFINGANARFFSPDLSMFTRATLIALDGNPVTPRPYKPFLLGSGMRMDVVVDVAGNNKNYDIIDRTYRKAYPLMRIRTFVKSIRPSVINQIPPPLPANPIAEPDLNRAITHNIKLEGGAMSSSMRRGMHKGLFWSINEHAMVSAKDYKEPLLSLKKGKSYVLRIGNHTRFSHPIHMHGHSFKVLNGKDVNTDAYWTDTVMLHHDDVIDVAFVADNPGQWMFHCHVLDHQESGMMGVIEVA